jgi:ATP-dependent protease ClpP protease subunit
MIVPAEDAWIYEWFGMEVVNSKKIIEAIDLANGQDIEVHINSPGGDLYAGSEIYTALKDYRGNTTGKIVGIAASAASIIAMGVKKLLISPTGQVMIHNVMSRGSGNHTDFEKMADVLKTADIGVCNAYMLKTGLSQEELLDLMEKETYMDAKTALDLKFVDEIMFDENMKLSASIENTSLLPESVLSRMRNFLKSSQTQEERFDNEAFFLHTKEIELKRKKYKEES